MSEPLSGVPAAPEFNLEPVVQERIVVPHTSQSIVSTEDYRAGTEFGGVAGLIQPPPHVPTAAERRSMIMFIDPTDPGDESPGSITPPELEGDFT